MSGISKEKPTYLRSYQTFMMEFFCENSCIAVNPLGANPT